MRLLSLVLVVACAPKAAPAPAAQAFSNQPFVYDAVVVPATAPVVPRATAGSRATLGPALEGERMALDLKSLARTQLDYTLRMETAELGRADARDERLLLTHLAADPRWRVAEVDGVLAAVRRSDDQVGWTATASGYHDQGEGPWRVLVRFGAWHDAHPWRTSDFVGRASAHEETAVVRGFLPPNAPYEGRVTTALSIDGDRVGVDVYEMGPSDDRVHTRWALGEVPSLLHNVRTLQRNLTAHGHERMLMPRGEPASGPPSLTIAGSGPGELDLRARVNPGAAGWVWLRLVTPGGVFDEAAVTDGSRERVGWSTNAADTFVVQSRFTVAPGPAFDATAELWFMPDQGEARPIFSERVRVPAR